MDTQPAVGLVRVVYESEPWDHGVAASDRQEIASYDHEAGTACEFLSTSIRRRLGLIQDLDKRGASAGRSYLMAGVGLGLSAGETSQKSNTVPDSLYISSLSLGSHLVRWQNPPLPCHRY